MKLQVPLLDLIADHTLHMQVESLILVIHAITAMDFVHSSTTCCYIEKDHINKGGKRGRANALVQWQEVLPPQSKGLHCLRFKKF